MATLAAGSTATGGAGVLTQGIGDAFLVLSGVAGVASLAALIVIPSAATFLPELRLAPRVAIH